MTNIRSDMVCVQLKNTVKCIFNGKLCQHFASNQINVLRVNRKDKTKLEWHNNCNRYGMWIIFRVARNSIIIFQMWSLKATGVTGAHSQRITIRTFIERKEWIAATDGIIYYRKIEWPVKKSRKILCAHLVFNVMAAFESRLLIFIPNGMHKNDKIRIVTTLLNCNGPEWALHGVWVCEIYFHCFFLAIREHSNNVWNGIQWWQDDKINRTPACRRYDTPFPIWYKLHHHE